MKFPPGTDLINTYIHNEIVIIWVEMSLLFS